MDIPEEILSVLTSIDSKLGNIEHSASDIDRVIDLLKQILKELKNNS